MTFNISGSRLIPHFLSIFERAFARCVAEFVTEIFYRGEAAFHRYLLYGEGCLEKFVLGMLQPQFLEETDWGWISITNSGGSESDNKSHVGQIIGLQKNTSTSSSAQPQMTSGPGPG